MSKYVHLTFVDALNSLTVCESVSGSLIWSFKLVVVCFCLVFASVLCGWLVVWLVMWCLLVTEPSNVISILISSEFLKMDTLVSVVM